MNETIQAGAELWKLGGIAAVLLAVLVAGGWLMFRFFVHLVRDLGRRLDVVQGEQNRELLEVVKANTRSNDAVTAASHETTVALRQMADVLRVRPCLIESGPQPVPRPTLPHLGG